MGKIDSIIELQNWGFNTPNLLLTIPVPPVGTRNGKGGIALWANQRVRCEQRGIKRVSIRTEKAHHSLCPHHPNIPLKDVGKVLNHCILAGYNIFIFEGIDPADCKCRGNVVLISPDLHFDFILGPGTVRDLEHKVPTHILFDPEKHLDFVPIAKKYMSQPELYGRILEWSIYNKPVGHLQQPEIYWEHRPWL
jgi:hypothetical protein